MLPPAEEGKESGLRPPKPWPERMFWVYRWNSTNETWVKRRDYKNCVYRIMPSTTDFVYMDDVAKYGEEPAWERYKTRETDRLKDDWMYQKKEQEAYEAARAAAADSVVEPSVPQAEASRALDDRMGES